MSGEDSVGLAPDGSLAEHVGWLGTINAWECDEMQRLELRFYVALAWQGILHHAAALGWNEALVLEEQHIRFHRELRPNVPAHLLCRLLGQDRGRALVLQRLVRTDTGETIATMRSTIAGHMAPASPEAPRPWAEGDVPEEARYRGLNRDTPLPDGPDLTGFMLTGRGVVLPHDCDGGRLRPELVLGRIAEATPHLVGPFNLAAREATGLSLGGASVECRLRYLRWPRPGDRYDVRSAIVGIDRRTQRLAHYMVDGASGQILASVEVVALMLDLDQRRAAAIPDPVLESMLRNITPIAARDPAAGA